MFGGFKLNIYSKGKCFLDCYFCNMIEQEPTITNYELLEFIKKNIHSVDKEHIVISGGEPLFDYDIDFYKEIINLGFKKIIINTNLLFPKKIDEIKTAIIESGKSVRLELRVSFNGLGDTTRDSKMILDNIKKYKEFITQLSMVVNTNTQFEMYEVAKIAKEIGSYIAFSPQIDNGKELYFLVNEDVVSHELEKIWKDDLYPYVVNYLKIESKREGNVEKCLSENIYISPTGSISSCEYTNDIYYSTMSSKDIIGNIKTNGLLSDLIPNMSNSCFKACSVETVGFDGVPCKECKKCTNWRCTTKSLENKKIEKNYCFFNRIFYDFVTKKAKFNRNIERINLFMTEMCNMKCTYCFEEDFKNRLGFASDEVIIKSIDLLLESKGKASKELQLFGGEPSLNINGIKLMANYYNNHPLRTDTNKIIFTVTSNMLELNQELMDAYDELAINTKLKIAISLDATKDTHDLNRIDRKGNGTFDRVIDNAKKYYNHINSKYGTKCYAKRNIEFSRHTVLTKNDVPQIDRIVNEMFEMDNYFDYQFFAHVNGDPDVMIQGDDIRKLTTRLYEIHDTLDDFWKERLIDYFSSHMIGIKAIHDFSTFNVCSAGDTMIGIRANGDIIPCHAFINRIDDENYEETVLMDNILKIKGYPYVMFADKKFILKDLSRKILSGAVEIENEHGKKCSECPLKEACNTCLAFVDIEDNKIIKKEEYCMRTFDNAEILLKIKEVKELEAYNNRNKEIDNKIKELYKGVATLGENMISLKEQVEANSEAIIEMVEDGE